MSKSEKINCSSSLICNDNSFCGRNVSLSEALGAFMQNNVGDLNTGWKEIEEFDSKAKYVYINVENVKSDTLLLTRINNDIIAEIPNIYGVKFYFDSTNGKLSLLGRDEEDKQITLSTIDLPIERIINDIEFNSEEHTITLKYINHEADVLNIAEILQMDNFYNKEEIDEIIDKITPKNIEYDETKTNRILKDKYDIKYHILVSGIFTIPECSHGYTSAITFLTGDIKPNITFINNVNNVEMKYVFCGEFINISNMGWQKNSQYDILILNDGRNIKIYIQEMSLT